MKIIFRLIPQTLSNSGERIAIGRFTPAVEADGVSATANTYGLSPLTCVCSALGYDHSMVSKASTRANRFKKIATLNGLKPKLILVPKTNGSSEIENLTDQLIEAASEANIQTLNFTHYGFVKDKLPTHEIIQVLHSMKKWRALTALKTIIWDIDRRHIEEMKTLEEYMQRNSRV